MDLTDWLLSIGIAAAFAVSFGLLLPPHGWIAGLIVAALMIFRAKRKRDSLK
jgi:hypothetical protein